MTRRREWLLVGGVGALAAVAGFAYNAWRTSPGSGATDAPAALASIRLPDLAGEPRSLSHWQGKVLVVNFWATWCAPCREEIPIFVKLQNEYGGRGLQFVGIALDQPEKVRPYAAELKMNFPILLGSIDAVELTRSLGNRAGALPFTVVLRRDGRVAGRHTGVFKEESLLALVSPLL